MVCVVVGRRVGGERFDEGEDGLKDRGLDRGKMGERRRFEACDLARTKAREARRDVGRGEGVLVRLLLRLGCEKGLEVLGAEEEEVCGKVEEERVCLGREGRGGREGGETGSEDVEEGGDVVGVGVGKVGEEVAEERGRDGGGRIGQSLVEVDKREVLGDGGDGRIHVGRNDLLGREERAGRPQALVDVRDKGDDLFLDTRVRTGDQVEDGDEKRRQHRLERLCRLCQRHAHQHLVQDSRV